MVSFNCPLIVASVFCHANVPQGPGNHGGREEEGDCAFHVCIQILVFPRCFCAWKRYLPFGKHPTPVYVGAQSPPEMRISC